MDVESTAQYLALMRMVKTIEKFSTEEIIKLAFLKIDFELDHAQLMIDIASLESGTRTDTEEAETRNFYMKILDLHENIIDVIKLGGSEAFIAFVKDLETIQKKNTKISGPIDVDSNGNEVFY